MYELPKTLKRDIENLRIITDKYRKNEIGTTEFKVNRVPMGIYEQRKDGIYMVRIRATGGNITPLQFIEVINIAEKYGSNLLYITTRQEIQIQNINIDVVNDILTELNKIGLSSKGGGGNTVRNILVAHDSEISKSEVFDPTPHADALTTKLISEPDSFSLSRKLKIAFSNNEYNTDFVAINDIGFVASLSDGKRGFKVYAGGSVASNPSIGWVIADFIPEEEIFAAAAAIKQLFSDHDNRKNKHKVRLRYIFYQLGETEFKRLFYEYFENAKERCYKYLPNDKPIINNGTFSPKYHIQEDHGFQLWRKRYVHEQRQEKKVFNYSSIYTWECEIWGVFFAG